MGILNIIPQKLRLAGRPVYCSRRAVAVFCSWQQPAGHAAVTKRGDKLAFARHDASMWPQKACVRASERLTELDPAASSAVILDQAILTSALPRNGTALFALVICAGCDLSSVFSKPSSGRGARRTNPPSLFTPFGCSYRPVSYYILYNGGFGFAEIRYSRSPSWRNHALNRVAP